MKRKTRNRGIIASRVKLETAMLNAGIKTQAALAEKIAAAEGITSPPKDTVNKAFRQEKISPATLTRIANILGVESYTLYLSKMEITALHQHDTSGEEVPLFWQSLESGSTSEDNSDESAQAIPENFSILICPSSREALPLINPTKQVLSDKTDCITIEGSLSTVPRMSIDQARHYQADGVVTIHVTKVRRFLEIQIFAFSAGVEKLIWTDCVLQTDLSDQKESLARIFGPYLVNFFSDETSISFDFERVQSQENYLSARRLLSDQTSEISIKRAQSLLDLALASTPDFAKAHAARGESYLADSWIGNEKQLLEKAQACCERALKLSPDDSYVQSVMAGVMRRTGRLSQSVSLYENILKAWPGNAEALSGLGSTLLAAYRQGADEIPNPLKRASDCLEKATSIEPDYWRHHSELGMVKYTAGNIPGAITSFERSAELQPNELSFVNIGTLYFCQGNIDQAKALYQRALDIAPQSHLGYEFLGTIFYFMGDYEESAKFRQRAVDLLDTDGGNFKMWGNLAESYRLINRIDEAENAYLKALTIIERDELRGNLEVSEIIHRDLYRLVLNEMRPDIYKAPDKHNTSYDFEESVEMDLETSTYIAIAQIELMNQHEERARRAFEKCIGICPVLSEHPLLNQLGGNA